MQERMRTTLWRGEAAEDQLIEERSIKIYIFKNIKSLYRVVFWLFYSGLEQKIEQGMVILANILKETYSLESAGIFVIPSTRDLTLSPVLLVN